MEEKLRGIVLSSINFGENDKILNVFTLEKGLVTSKIKGVKKAGAKMKFASEPFCFAEFIFSEKSGKRTVIGASLIDSFYPVREDIQAYFMAGAGLEYTRRTFKEGIVSKEHFLLLVDFLKDLSYSEKDKKSVFITFLLSALKSSGYEISINGCFGCGKEIKEKVYFDYTTGAFICKDCTNDLAREVSLITYNGLNRLMNGEQIASEESDRIIRLLDYYIDNKLEEKINSLKELIKIL